MSAAGHCDFVERVVHDWFVRGYGSIEIDSTATCPAHSCTARRGAREYPMGAVVLLIVGGTRPESLIARIQHRHGVTV